MCSISIELQTLIERARNGKLLSKEYGWGTFTLSNLGMFGVEHFTSIINPPEVAILGIGAIVDIPRVINENIIIRPVFKATLTSDHRVVDGELNAKFLQRLKSLCEQE